MGNTTSNQHPSIPLELAAIIFEYACDDYKAYVWNAINTMERDTPLSEPPVIQHRREQRIASLISLSQVCRVWKEVIYNTPTLWDTVFVDFKVPDDIPPVLIDERISCVMRKLKDWLDRAGNRPLTIKIAGAELIQKTMLDYSEQWKHIDIHCSEHHPEVFQELERIMVTAPKRLETFILRPSSHCLLLGASNGFEDHPNFQIKHAPNLSSIARFPHFHLSLPFSSLKVSKWDGMDELNVVDQLGEMRNLRDCFIYRPFSMQDWGPPYASSVRRLPLLQNLTIHSSLRQAHGYILPRLKLPGLQTFTFSNLSKQAVRPERVTDIIRVMIPFLQRSNGQNLRSLDLDIASPVFVANELLDLLRIVPNLEHLNIALRGLNSPQVPIRVHPSSSLPEETISLSRLISYHINLASLDYEKGGNFENEPSILLKYISMPALNDFQIVLPSHMEATSIVYPAALGLLDRSSCPLKTLKLNTENNVSNAPLLDVLKRQPTLECLHIIGQNYDQNSREDVKLEITNGLFELLLPGPHVYLPRLSELSCEGVLTTEEHIITSALEYRWNGDSEGSHDIAKLSRFHMYLSQLRGRRYRELSGQGMDIKLTIPSRFEERMQPVRY